MKKLLVIAGIAAIFFAAPFGATDVTAKDSWASSKIKKPKAPIATHKYSTYPKQVRGKKGRKYVRRFSLRANLQGDKLEVYDKLGYTPHRLRFREYGQVKERWRYHSLGLEFWFDEEGNMLSKLTFPPVSGHID